MQTEFDHLLLIGFGGPEKPEDVKPFLQEVTRGIPIPAERLEEVLHHYEAIGGSSPYNEYTRRLFVKIRECLSARGITLPFYSGMRNWHPFMKDTMAGIAAKGLRKGLGIVLAPHRSDASFEKYVRCVEEAKKYCGVEIEYEYIRGWHDHPGFTGAQADMMRRALLNQDIASTHVIFCAHSIPVEMASRSKYVEEFQLSCSLAAREAGIQSWSTAYQSRSGSPRQPWLEPDVISLFEGVRQKGFKSVLLVPIGFLCDNAEVLFDLDIEARQEAEKTGLRYLRASTVMDHPAFAEMFAERVQEHLTSCRC